MQSAAKATGSPNAFASAGSTGCSDIAVTRLPSGRPKCDSTMTLRALVRKLADRRSPPLDARRVGDRAVLHRHVQVDAHQHALARASSVVERANSAARSDQLAHRDGGVGHAVREAPFIVVPAHHAHEIAVHHLGLIEREARRRRIVVEVDRDQRRVDDVEDALELLRRGALHRRR